MNGGSPPVNPTPPSPTSASPPPPGNRPTSRPASSPWTPGPPAHDVNGADRPGGATTATDPTPSTPEPTQRPATTPPPRRTPPPTDRDDASRSRRYDVDRRLEQHHQRHHVDHRARTPHHHTIGRHIHLDRTRNTIITRHHRNRQHQIRDGIHVTQLAHIPLWITSRNPKSPTWCSGRPVRGSSPARSLGEHNPRVKTRRPNPAPRRPPVDNVTITTCPPCQPHHADNPDAPTSAHAPTTPSTPGQDHATDDATSQASADQPSNDATGAP